MSEAYALIDRFLRNNLDDADYATFSDALETVLASLPSERTEAEDARPIALEALELVAMQPATRGVYLLDQQDMDFVKRAVTALKEQA